MVRADRRPAARLAALAVVALTALAACAPPPAAHRTHQASPARLVVPAIGLDRTIVRGGQAAIDAGQVTLYDDGPGGWDDPIEPGQRGTYWLAAHRSSNGSTFARIAELAPGDEIHVLTGNRRVIYVVTGREVVDDWVGSHVIYGTDPAARRILLQCSWPGDQRLLVVGEAVRRH